MCRRNFLCGGNQLSVCLWGQTFMPRLPCRRPLARRGLNLFTPGPTGSTPEALMQGDTYATCSRSLGPNALPADGAARATDLYGVEPGSVAGPDALPARIASPPCDLLPPVAEVTAPDAAGTAA